MTVVSVLAIHVAVAYLHFMFVLRIFPRRKDNRFVFHFWLLMQLCLTLHTIYSVYYILLLLEAEKFQNWVLIAGYYLLALFPALLSTLFLGELTVLPAKGNFLTRGLSVINANYKRLFTLSMILALLSMLPTAYIEFTSGHFYYSFGNPFALMYTIMFLVL